MASPPGPTTQIALRVPSEWLTQADALVEYVVSKARGVRVTRTDVLRMAILRGLESLEQESTPGPAAP